MLSRHSPLVRVFIGVQYSIVFLDRWRPTLATQVVDFACGEHHVVCLTSDGQLFEWGDRSWLEPHRVLSPQDEERWNRQWNRLDGRKRFTENTLDCG